MMRLNMKFKWCILILLLLLTMVSKSQWQSDTQLTDSGDNAFLPRISVAGSEVHIVWINKLFENRRVHYKRSIDNGYSWGGTICLTDSSAYALTPSIFVSNSVVHIVWIEVRDNIYDVYYRNSYDDGNSWEKEIKLTNSTVRGFFNPATQDPDIKVSNQLVHVAWGDFRNGNYEIYYMQSTDLGKNWMKELRLTNGIDNSFSPTMSISNSTIHMVWDNRGRKEDQTIDFSSFRIVYKNSFDDGVNWNESFQLSSLSPSSFPSISSSGKFVHVVWQCSDLSGNSNITFIQSTNEGLKWSLSKNININSKHALKPSISVSGSFLCVVWNDDWYDDRRNNQAGKIYYVRSTDNGKNFEIDKPISNLNNTFLPRIIVNEEVIHLVWHTTNEKAMIYYKQALGAFKSW